MQKVFLCPNGKFPPVGFGQLPKDLDRIKFGTVGRRIDKNEPMLIQPFIDFLSVDIAIHRCIGQDDDDRLAVDVLHYQSIDVIADLGPLAGALMQHMCKRVGGIVERTKNVYSLAITAGVGAIWHAAR